MEEFIEIGNRAETDISEFSELDTERWMGLQNIRIPAQRELASCDDAQANTTEE